MSIEKVRKYLSAKGYADKILEFDVSSATVELAALALNTKPERIAKTLSFYKDSSAILIVAAGDVKIDNKKFREEFGFKAKMLSVEDVEPFIGHKIGGVCPFGIKEDVEVYLDNSLKRFETVFPACGSSNSAIELTIDELDKLSNNKKWVDVTKL